MSFDHFSEAESLLELAHQDQAAVGSSTGTLEIDLERGVKRDLKGMNLELNLRFLLLNLLHRVRTVQMLMLTNILRFVTKGQNGNVG